MSALAPDDAINLAVSLLAARAFRITARNERGDSFYLRACEGTAAIRVSNHARTAKQRKNHPDAITSLVLRDPTSEAALAAAVAVALRNFVGERAKREGALPA